MQTKYLTRIFAILLAILTFAACDRSKEEEPSTDPRDIFVGDYSFVSTGSIDLYAGALKRTVPMNEKGNLSIALGKEANTVWVIAAGDSTLAYVSDNQLLMEPTEDEATFGDLVMEMSFTYGKATLKDNQLSWTSDVDITASYKDHLFLGSGKVDIVATKK